MFLYNKDESVDEYRPVMALDSQTQPPQQTVFEAEFQDEEEKTVIIRQNSDHVQSMLEP